MFKSFHILSVSTAALIWMGADAQAAEHILAMDKNESFGNSKPIHNKTLHKNRGTGFKTPFSFDITYFSRTKVTVPDGPEVDAVREVSFSSADLENGSVEAAQEFSEALQPIIITNTAAEAQIAITRVMDVTVTGVLQNTINNALINSAITQTISSLP